MNEQLKSYRAMVWVQPDQPGKRVTVLARTLAEAKKQLEAQYGEGKVLDLHDQEEADQPR